MKTKNALIYIVILVFLAIVLGAYFEAHNPEDPVQTIQGIATSSVPTKDLPATSIEVFFTDPKNPFDDIYLGGIEENLIEKIESANSSIDVAVFEFNINSVAQALIEASERGVLVRVVYDNEHTDDYTQIGDLTKAGIVTVPDNRSSYMHNKFFVFDNQCIWTGSFNISMNAAYRNNENAIYFCSSEAASNYSTEFEEMYMGQYGSTSQSNTPHPSFYVDDVYVENYFSPEDGVMEKVVSVIEQVKVQFIS